MRTEVFFKKQYLIESGEHVSLSYLKESKVHMFCFFGKPIGGFVLSNNSSSFRIINEFVFVNNQADLYRSLPCNNCIELTCFWIKKAYRNNAFFQMYVWFGMIFSVFRQKNEYVLYGTKVHKLFKIYNLPKKSNLIHKDLVDGVSTYVFLGERVDFFKGILEILLHKFHVPFFTKRKGKF